MTDVATHIDLLFTAELQFRLASAVRLAVTMENQPLDLPLEWSHGKHNVSYKFAHSPFNPVWSIDPDCRNRVFEVRDVVSLDTTDLQRVAFNWRHYGGPLAMLRLCRYVRFEILKDPKRTRQIIPIPKDTYYQQGSLILKQAKKSDKKN